jgi:pilus assembly protein FimV
MTPEQGATTVRRLALVPILVCAFLFPPGAAALGLGDIELQSALNQRLDAEIPLRGVPEDRAEDIIVTLASEQAFQDVGLQRPFSLTKLRFQVRQSGSGGYYVHVTSSEAIVEPFLSFLVEVDWPGGNLLREYTVLLDPPVFASEETEPSTATATGDGGSASTDTGMAATGDAAEAGVPGEIDREGAAEGQAGTRTGGTQDEATAVAEAEPDPEASARSADEQRSEERFGDEPVFLQVEREEDEAQRRLAERQATAREEERRRRQESAQAEPYEPEAEQAARESSGTTAGSGAAAADAQPEAEQPAQYGPVAEGETLWNIASRLRSGDISVQQMMLALLRYNPEAFAGGNINRLRQGYVLRVPERAEVRRLSAQEAVARVGEQNALWEEWRRAQAGQETRVAQRRDEETAADAADAAPEAGDDARLSIVGSPEGGASADEQASATSASEASTSEQLRLAREQLESTEMEKQELQSRVAELEETVRKMEQLITLRENRLNELQEQLKRLQREQGGEPADPADTAGEDTTQVAEAEATEDEAAEGAAGTAADGDGGDGSGAGAPEAGGGDDTQLAEAEQGADAGSEATATTGAGEDARDADAATTAEAETSADGAAAGDAAEETAAETGETNEAGTTAGADAADGGEEAAAQAETAAAEDTEAADPGVVTTRTQPAEKTWLDTIIGFGSAAMATAGGVLASIGGGGLFAGPTSPGVLGAAALLILALGLVVVRRRRAAGEAGTEPSEAEDLETFGEQGDWTAPEEADVDQLDQGSDVIAEELGDSDTTQASESVDEAETALFEESFDLGSLDETSPAQPEAEEATESKDDTVAEADVYLAYGLHQQAEDLLRLALRESPERADYHEKLLETLYGAGKQEDFVTQAERFRELVSSPKSRAWQRVLAMGKELAPSAALFSAAADPGIRREELQPEKPATTDIELDAGGDSSVDFGFDEDAGANTEGASEDFSETLMFDTSELEKADGDAGLTGPHERAGATAEADETAASGTGQEEELEFDLGELEELDAGEPTGAGEEPTGGGQAPPASGAGSGAEDEALEFDLSELDDEGAAASGEDTDESAAAGVAASEDPEATLAATGSSDFGDFDFDFDLDEDSGQRAGHAAASADDTGDSASPTEGAGDDDDFSLDFGELDAQQGEDTSDSGGVESTMTSDGGAGLGTAASDSAQEESGTQAASTEHGEEEDFEFDLGELEGIPGEPDLSSSDLDDEFAGSESTADETAVAETGSNDSGEEAEPYEDEPSIDFDIGGLEGESPGEETADSAAEEEATATGSGPDSSADDDEFDTMLDLAKAYIDMGDSESASDALEEVIQAGNEAQRREAKGLLETVQ